jgi:uncharacterized protein YndB with AHSA1/START domain
MTKMHFSETINAPARKVWDVMLGDKTYREWTRGFNPDGESYFEGDWSLGSRMRFLGPDKDGNIGGMFSEVEESRPGEFISLHHLGILQGDKESPSDEWNSYEKYAFTEENGKTRVDVELEGANIPEDFVKMFEETWPKALTKLKELAEEK